MSLFDAPFPEGKQMDAYQITCFRGKEVTPTWSKEYHAEREHGNSGPFLLAAREPDPARSNLQYLSWLKDDLLVCAGPRQDILDLDKETGQIHWRLARVWEFQRGFIGPSVWSHYIGRFGEQDTRASMQAPPRDSFDKRYQCALIAGPVVVPRTIRQSWGKNGPHIFVAVSKAEVGNYSEYLADCIVYELNEDGIPIGMVNLPRLVNGAEYQVQPDALIWGCQNEALVKLVTTNEGHGFDGFGGPDKLIRVAWYQQYAPYKPQAWLLSDSCGQLSAFTNGTLYRIHAGGFVLDSKVRVYQFPISMIDTVSGKEQNLLLKVPYSGYLPLPKTNFSQTTSGKQTSTQAFGPYILTITRLQVEGQVLRITVEKPLWSANVDFDMTNLSAPKG
jgi:hypothetical protein